MVNPVQTPTMAATVGLLARLADRYALPKVPACRICKDPLTRTASDPHVYACLPWANTTDTEVKPGRRVGDDHYTDSLWADVRRGGDPDVLDLVRHIEASGQLAPAVAAEVAWETEGKATWVLDLGGICHLTIIRYGDGFRWSFGTIDREHASGREGPLDVAQARAVEAGRAFHAVLGRALGLPGYTERNESR